MQSHEMPMSVDSVILPLTPDSRASLLMLLSTALELSEGSHVVDHLPVNPWGDIDEFRRAVFLPLHGNAESSAPTPHREEVVLSPDEVAPIRAIVDGLAESISGGCPWVELTDPEREAAERLVARLQE